ncbi:MULTISPECIES: hypothetical protein [unclassified Streptomyces]|uniref:hypothetical protein n=1 Tax=unclassified Streptomyces TaxID=2593676 RepID=UPI00344C7C90
MSTPGTVKRESAGAYTEVQRSAPAGAGRKAQKTRQLQGARPEVGAALAEPLRQLGLRLLR